MSDTRTLALVNDLLKAELPWVELKENNTDPEKIGVYISALCNAARLGDQQFGYLFWGVRDADRRIAGTDFDPSTETCQKQPLEFWLAKRLNPDVSFQFKVVHHPAGRVVMLEIPAAVLSPVEFDGVAYIRIGSATPKLSAHPQRQRALWDKLRPFVWENGIAEHFQTEDEVLAKLDHEAYFSLTGQPQPSVPQAIIDRLFSESLIMQDVGGRWNITNLGALLFARKLDRFDSRISRKGIRFVAYDGKDRASVVTHRHDGVLGYAAGFEEITAVLNGLLPRNEHIDRALRTATPLFPPIAIRELIANALIHQDMTITGAGPLIELFRDRMEITNPGVPLINPDRFIDTAPRSRNETLASLMRRMRICEEQGTGIDKVVTAVELFQLPPPDFRVEESATRVVLFAPRRFAEMSADERVRACYQHAVLKYLSGDRMKNSTLRERLGIAEQNAAQVSQVIRQALERGLIRPADPGKKQAAYVPNWA